MADSVFKRYTSPTKPSRAELEARLVSLAEGLTPEAREALIQTVPLGERAAVRAMLADPEATA